MHISGSDAQAMTSRQPDTHAQSYAGNGTVPLTVSPLGEPRHALGRGKSRLCSSSLTASSGQTIRVQLAFVAVDVDEIRRARARGGAWTDTIPFRRWTIDVEGARQRTSPSRPLAYGEVRACDVLAIEGMVKVSRGSTTGRMAQ